MKLLLARTCQCLLIILISAGMTYAEAERFTASANKQTVGLNETFKVTFELESANGNDFQPPEFKYFKVLGGPNPSTSVRIINGNMKRSTAYSYFLRPKKTGKYSIGAASIQANGKTLQTNSLNITVKKGGGSTNNGNQQNKNQSIEEKIEDNLFLKLYVSDTEVFQGEQVTATYKLYTRYQIGRTRLSETPSYSGFWSEEIQQPKNLNYKRETYQGREYNTALLASVALFPQRTGKLTLDPMQLETVVRVPVKRKRRSVFGNPFGSYKNMKYDFKSNRMNIKVKPLPSNQPKSFTGAVGQFDYEVSLDNKATQVGEPITVKVNVSGAGNLKLMEAPNLDLPNDFEVYDPKIKSDINRRSGKIQGAKTFDYLIVPKRPGKFKLPPLTFSYFNPESEKYKTISSPEYTINVSGKTTTEGSTTQATVRKDEVEMIGKDIRYIKTGSANLQPKGKLLLGSAKFVGLYATPILLFLIAFVYRERQQKNQQDTVGFRKKKANKIARKRLFKAKKLMNNSEDKPFYDEVVRAIWGYLSDKLNIEQAGLTQDNVEEMLLQKDVSQEKVDELKQMLNDCEMALFAPSASNNAKDQIYSRATELITSLEQQLK